MLELIKQVYARQGVEWVEPYTTTVSDLFRTPKVGSHTGHYWIGDNYYFGRAMGSQKVKGRFKPHYAKLNARFDWLFAASCKLTEEQARAKIHNSSAHWKIGEGWKDLHRDILIDNCPEFPKYFRETPRGFEAGDFHFPAKPKVDIDSMKVIVWNLNHLTAEQIASLEKEVIRTIWPYANSDTHDRRVKQNG
jgi:hypothetical protein